MSLEIKKLEKSEVEISGEMPAEEFSKFWQKAISELSKNTSIPGFRPGKIPDKILVERAGEGAVLDKAAELAIRDVYPRILEEKKIEAIGVPEASVTKVTKGGPLGFKFKTAVLPELELPENYKEISARIVSKKEEIIVEDKEIDASIEYLRKMKAKDSDKESDEPKLPELNDEFAKSLGSFECLNDLKDNIKKNLQREKEIKNKDKKRLEILDAVLKECKLETPNVLIEAEKNKMLSDFKANITSMGLKWEDYLKNIKKKDLSAEDLAKVEEELLAGWTEDALKRVNYGLLLKHLNGILNIEVSDAEIEERIKEFVIQDKSNVDDEHLKDYAYGIIKNDKVFKFLESC